jgi:hypothetical protein
VSRAARKTMMVRRSSVEENLKKIIAMNIQNPRGEKRKSAIFSSSHEMI